MRCDAWKKTSQLNQPCPPPRTSRHTLGRRVVSIFVKYEWDGSQSVSAVMDIRVVPDYAFHPPRWASLQSAHTPQSAVSCSSSSSRQATTWRRHYELFRAGSGSLRRTTVAVHGVQYTIPAASKTPTPSGNFRRQ